jgi:hypothetical protein
MRAVMVGMKLMPSPKESMVEKMLRETAERGETLPPIMRASVGAEAAAADVTSSGCPMGFGMDAPDQVAKTEG